MDFPYFTEDEQPTMANFNEKFRALLGADAIVVTGTYTGTGVYGESNPNSLSFDFPPKLVMIPYMKSSTGLKCLTTGRDYNYCFVAMDVLTTAYQDSCGFGSEAPTRIYRPYGRKSADGKTIQWYISGKTSSGDTLEAEQFNSLDATYYFIAIG